ncbi:hypothetical protein GCM10023210_29000 [Chryseobacterium ginsengisoli]|uniref:N-acetyltransferase domain-containing protein n=1 Tax=Chryseobacterium ginsengisoli TaxID=363853 RepID=A0ABP9MJ04_9FLAO
MKPEFENIPLIDTGSRFEIEFNGSSAFIDYRQMGSQIALNHTESDLLIAGTGAAAAVVEKTLSYIEEHKKKHFPFVRTLQHSSKKIRNGSESWTKDFMDMTSFNFH